MAEYEVRHNEVHERNSWHNCTECGDTDLRLEVVEWIDCDDGTNFVKFIYICKRNSHRVEIPYLISDVPEDYKADVE